MRYQVPLIGQADPQSCWAAAFAMILSWAEGRLFAPERVIIETGHAFRPGLPAEERFPFDHYGFVIEPPRTWTPGGFFDLLATHGPLWCAAAPDLNDDGIPDPHVVVVTGMDPDPGPESRVYINDPWDWEAARFRPGNRGAAYDIAFRALLDVFLAPLQRRDAADHLSDAIYLAHLRMKPRLD